MMHRLTIWIIKQVSKKEDFTVSLTNYVFIVSQDSHIFWTICTELALGLRFGPRFCPEGLCAPSSVGSEGRCSGERVDQGFSNTWFLLKFWYRVHPCLNFRFWVGTDWFANSKPKLGGGEHGCHPALFRSRDRFFVSLSSSLRVFEELACDPHTPFNLVRGVSGELEWHSLLTGAVEALTKAKAISQALTHHASESASESWFFFCNRSLGSIFHDPWIIIHLLGVQYLFCFDETVFWNFSRVITWMSCSQKQATKLFSCIVLTFTHSGW